MNRKKQEYYCELVNETVMIHLCKKTTAGWKSSGEFFVQCDQGECQHVDNNQLPCPLNLSLFDEEILKRKEKAQKDRESPGY